MSLAGVNRAELRVPHIDLINRSKRETMRAEWENVEQNLLRHTFVVNNDTVGR